MGLITSYFFWHRKDYDPRKVVIAGAISLGLLSLASFFLKWLFPDLWRVLQKELSGYFLLLFVLILVSIFIHKFSYIGSGADESKFFRYLLGSGALLLLVSLLALIFQ